MPGPRFAIAPERTLDGALGFELEAVGDGRAVGRMAVADRVRQPFGIVHGGAYAALAESLASIGTHEAVAGEGLVPMGLSNQTSFLRPVAEGTVQGEARRRHRGRTTWIWDVEFTDDEGRTCALSRVTVALRPSDS
ncbi:MAG: PaaI family thioesterase [Actinomycetota bacterium]|nr:PaaI family thioesterase [Actinomycetota bacterium]